MKTVDFVGQKQSPVEQEKICGTVSPSSSCYNPVGRNEVLSEKAVKEPGRIVLVGQGRNPVGVGEDPKEPVRIVGQGRDPEV